MNGAYKFCNPQLINPWSSDTTYGAPYWIIIGSDRLVGFHYNDVITGAIASQITSLTIVFSTVYSDADQRKHQSSASLAFVQGIHRGPVNSPHKWPVTRKMFPFGRRHHVWRCQVLTWTDVTLQSIKLSRTHFIELLMEFKKRLKEMHLTMLSKCRPQNVKLSAYHRGQLSWYLSLSYWSALWQWSPTSRRSLSTSGYPL